MRNAFGIIFLAFLLAQKEKIIQLHLNKIWCLVKCKKNKIKKNHNAQSTDHWIFLRDFTLLKGSFEFCISN